MNNNDDIILEDVVFEDEINNDDKPINPKIIYNIK